MAKKKWKTNFADCVKYEEEILGLRLSTIRAGISHPGKKGTSVENQVLQFLRSFLPSEYGLSTVSLLIMTIVFRVVRRSQNTTNRKIRFCCPRN